ncbi:uncharacterized protein LOC132695849 isoform X2 [Cylas formicarius]|uniref:uncharacterized protein LOC132695849 isoform X2 n=1 Tax=Cylas formicarius TaxID=197179 RepID=UPI002958C939|nr:uncharacterized protein LOC132695849 isoform X2 [Cylas formicarius]
MPYSTRYSPNVTRMTENEHNSWYDECTCCPYGYHIDLDFVRYCESISKEADNRTGSIKRRKDRRRQRQSMEVLLGLTPPVLAALEGTINKTNHAQEEPKIIPKQTTTSTEHFHFNDDFDDAVSDFERALQRSKNKLSNNLPDVTAVSASLRRVPSTSSLSSTSESVRVLPINNDGIAKVEFDSVSVESCGLSPMALQNIREALALSLERTKELENRVRLIPELQDQLLALKRDNRQLSAKLKTEENLRLQIVNGDYFQLERNRKRSQSFTHIDSFDSQAASKKEPPAPPPRKDFGVMCGVLTRNIGVGHHYPNTKHAATTTANLEYSDKWLAEKAKFLNNQNIIPCKSTVTKGTQTLFVKEKRDVGIQSAKEKSSTSHFSSQTVNVKPEVISLGIMATVSQSNAAVQKNVESNTIGCSDDSINDEICVKCRILKHSIGIGPDKCEDVHTAPVSLALLSARSKSFNLGEEGRNFNKRTRSVGCQYEPNSISRACQFRVKTQSQSSQHELKYSEKSAQYEHSLVSKLIGTDDLKLAVRHVASEAKEDLKQTRETSINTVPLDLEKSCPKCSTREKEDAKEFKKEAGSPTPSRIPVPTTPIEARKFRRQDTYTKIYPSSPTDRSPPPTLILSGLDLSPKAVSAESISPFDKVKQNLRLEAPTTSSDSKVQNGVSLGPITKVQVQETILPVSESTIFHPSSQNRKIVSPSREMQGAMKVLNDSLQKSSKVIKNQSAVTIVQEEWFKISSLVTANPLDVEDYLDAFEEMSSLLLEYVVNMTDVSGNTAMHYAVSYGNFDVVSILLDSKVCDINKPNKAGYTSVMLVSLAEVRSQTHANVVRRLFQLADVNIRAKQHGQTALMLAVSHGRFDMVKMLLDAGADINIQDEDGSTALMCAAEHGYIEIVKHFLNQPDCDSSITDVDGSTALKIAMEAGHRHIGVLLYAHERNYQKSHSSKLKKTKSSSPKTPSSPLPIRSSHRALTDTKK